MKQFDPTMRIYFEKSKDGLNTKLLTEIRRIEAKAREFSKAGRDGRAETAGDVQELESKLSVAQMKAVQNYQAVLDEYADKWRRDRDRKPNNELARLERARNRIDALTDDELRELAINFDGGMAAEEANLIASRLRADPESRPEYDLFRESMKQHHVNQPWLNIPEAAELHKNLETLQNTKAGYVPIDAEGQQYQTHIETLIDFDGELDGPA